MLKERFYLNKNWMRRAKKKVFINIGSSKKKCFYPVRGFYTSKRPTYVRRIGFMCGEQTLCAQNQVCVRKMRFMCADRKICAQY